MKNFLIKLILFTFFTFQIHAEIERRGAFDLGSGAFKLLVADVDTETHEVVKYVFSDSIRVNLSDRLSKNSDGIFDEELRKQAVQAIATLIQRAEAHHPNRFFGVGTAAFRLAKNGDQLANEISQQLFIPVRILTQIEEAQVGFDSAVAHSKGDPKHAIVWDIGSGSFQITWKDQEQIQAYMGNFGKVPMKNIIISIQGKSIENTASPNPISRQQAEQGRAQLTAQLDKVPDSLRNKLKNSKTKVYGIGAIHHGNIAVSTCKSSYTLDVVNELISQRLDREDSSFEGPLGGGILAPYWVSDLIFVSSIMPYVGFTSVIDVRAFDDPKVEAGGSTVGIVINPDFWR